MGELRREVTIGSLYSGIAGLELGVLAAFLESGAPARIAWQCEIDPFCTRVLAHHFPGVKGLFPTPSASSYGTNQGGAAGRTGPVRESLDTMARSWATPQSRDERGPTGQNGRDRRSSLSDQAIPPPATGGRLNPEWVLVLMGFPSTWLDTPSPPIVASSNSRGSRRARSRAA